MTRKEKINDIFKKAASKISFIWNKVGNVLLGFFNRHTLLVCMALITIMSLVSRYLVIQYPTNDIAGIVFSWMKGIQSVGFSKFYTVQNDYSPIYMFIIAVMSLFPNGKEITNLGFTYYSNWMYYLKSFIFVFDLLSAIGIYLLIKEITGNKKYAGIGYMVFLVLPVQFLSTAIWGQCDNIYFCLFIFCIYSIFKKKDWLAWLLLGVNIGFKLQSVFIIPFFVYLVLKRKLKLYPFFLSFIGLLLTFLPSYLCGASFTQPFSYLTTQVGRYTNLTLGCGNMWHLFDFPSDGIEIVNKASAWIGLSLIGVCLAIVYMMDIDLSKKENVLYVGVFLIGIVPFFLPHMHERYFYPIDVLVLVYALVKNKKYYLVLLMQISSGIAYYHYLSGKYFIAALGEDSVHISAYINLAVLVLIFYDLLKISREPTKDSKLVINSDKGVDNSKASDGGTKESENVK